MPTAKTQPANTIVVLKISLTQNKDRFSKIKQRVVRADEQYDSPVMLITITEFSLRIFRQASMVLRQHSIRQRQHWAAKLVDYLLLLATIILMTVTMVITIAAKVKEPMWQQFIHLLPLQKQLSSIAQYQKAQATAIRKVITQFKKNVMKMQWNRNSPQNACYFEISSFLDSRWFALELMARMLTSQKEKQAKDMIIVQTGAQQTDIFWVTKVAATLRSAIPSSILSLKQMIKIMKKMSIIPAVMMMPIEEQTMPTINSTTKKTNVATSRKQTIHLVK